MGTLPLERTKKAKNFPAMMAHNRAYLLLTERPFRRILCAVIARRPTRTVHFPLQTWRMRAVQPFVHVWKHVCKI